ncbi:MAG: molybdenum cofactor guanylyltransferase [Myxococcota bacterium]
MSGADAACAIIAGGAARRLDNAVKPLIEVAGQTILDRILAVLRPRFTDIAIAANDPALGLGRGLPVLPDRTPGQGPLAGIRSALEWCPRSHLLVVPGDMPCLRGEVVDVLLTRCAPGDDAVVPYIAGLPEPLLALYHTRCLAEVERRLDRGQRKVAALLDADGLTVRRVAEDTLRAIDPELHCFININTPDDLARAAARLGGSAQPAIERPRSIDEDSAP